MLNEIYMQRLGGTKVKNKNEFSLRRYAWTLLIGFLIVGWFYPAIGLAALICMTAPVIVALTTGKRKWCALFCPRGIFNDVILSKISRSKKAPAFFRSTGFKLVFLLFLFYTLFSGLSAADNLVEIGLVFVRLVSITTAIGVIVGIAFHQRTWCGFCPMGFLAGLSIRLRQWWHDRPREDREAPTDKGVGVVLYTAHHCPSCEKIESMIKEKGIPYKEYNIDSNKDARNNLIALRKNLTVPTLLVKGRILPAGNLDKLEHELDKYTTPRAG